jgi:hypothetical protein
MVRFLELLSPARSGLGLGSCIFTFYLLSPRQSLLFPISAKNRDLGDGFGTAFGGFRQFGALSGGLRKLVVDIIPKSMNRFMEWPPMKIVQP